VAGLTRRLLLAAAGSTWLRERATKTPFVKRSVSAFMPGERLEDAMNAAATLRVQGIGAIFTKLGENLTRPEEAEAVTLHYLDALDRISAAGLDAHLSVKPTQLGLDFDAELCVRNIQRLLDRASERQNFIWIDMESSAYVDRTLDLFRRSRARSSRVGVALQAYLHRTREDVESLLPLGPAIRIVKGAYLEPASTACENKKDVDENFLALAERIIGASPRVDGTFLQIATHDPRLSDRLAAVADEHRLTSSHYEFAMLYGIQRQLQQRLARSGRPVRILVAYGDYWFQWYMRRLAERPANLWFVAKNILR
jgi:proline dehydrogenase